MHCLNIRTLNIFLFEFKTVQSIRQYIQFQPSQFLHVRQFNITNYRYYSLETSSNGYKQYQNTRNKHSSHISFCNSLPNKNAFIQALRKQVDDDAIIKPKIDKEEKIKLKSHKEVVKVRFVR